MDTNAKKRRSMNRKNDTTFDSPYPPISDYGFISDCHSMALVSTRGSIDWCVMPRIDSSSVFARILDWSNGGYCRVSPDIDNYEVTRRYLGDSLILETTFIAGEARAKVYDFFAMRRGGRQAPHGQIIRIVEGVKNSMPIRVILMPRFDYGMLKPWILRRNHGRDFAAIGGHQGLLISSDIALSRTDNHGCTGTFVIHESDRRYVSITHRPPHLLDMEEVEVPDREEIEKRCEQTIEWWRIWSSQADCEGPYREQAMRSAVVLKGLTNAPTGAIAAAATTSLPEEIGGSRNWDYRFTWVRDSIFTVRSLAALGFVKEADGFRRFIERTAAGDAKEIQVLFGVGGEHHAPERPLPKLEGYRNSKPVRIGNAAAEQIQHDVFGELLDLAYNWHLFDKSPDEDYWSFILQLVERTIRIWRNPDHGFWEIRGEPRHFVQSKAMCWVALDCGIRLVEEMGLEADVRQWESERAAIRDWIEKNGYDDKRGVYVQAPESMEMDASLLLLPTFRYIEFDDERMVRTTDTIWRELGRDGMLMRYPHDNDGMEGREGAFLCCTFWLAEVLAKQKRMDEARSVFESACKTANDLGLYSEEFDAREKRMLGNFPQGLSHLSCISAAVAIGR
jgi:GH15 family glucan-1,4-alpha-glucosidase